MLNYHLFIKFNLGKDHKRLKLGGLIMHSVVT